MRLIIVTNRAPVNIVKEDGKYRYEESSGGLASGLRSYIDRMKKENQKGPEIIWIGWPGAAVEDEITIGKEIQDKFGVHSIFFSEDTMEKFYSGFCNKTIWPLFHYFPAYTVYENEFWTEYKSVNEAFCKEILKIYRPGDVIWIHDYHLMLTPAMVRKELPNASIGFFLHIPFPSYEVFRLLPSMWRKELLEGIYGADLIGFHTYDYCTYFLRSTMRILGLTNNMGEIFYQNRLVKVSTFPMGIDYKKYHDSVSAHEVQSEIEKVIKNKGSNKIILSIDRQDYTKGILNRLKGYEYFLRQNPHWKEKVKLMMIIIPSRIGVESYQEIKSKIDEMVGRINGEFGNLEWMPINYQYRSLSFPELIALYNTSEVGLITPLRDGMNLIAKEYIASKNGNGGALVLSEMAGAMDELTESIIINPNNTEEIGNALVHALEMGKDEQIARMEIMQNRLKTCDVVYWVNDFFDSMNSVKKKQRRLNASYLNQKVKNEIIRNYKSASSRTLFFDYDGTLVPYVHRFGNASPGKELLSILEKLSKKSNTDIVIISGRSRQMLEKWFSSSPVHIVAEHGILIKERQSKWKLIKPIRKNWKKKISPILYQFVEKLPGAFMEEKEFSLVFHYRESDPEFAELRKSELVNYLTSFTANMDIQVMECNHSIEIRNAGVDKGVAAMHWLDKKEMNSNFVLSIGDDLSDEDIFRVMPPGAYSIKVGMLPSYARFNLGSPEEVVNFLKDLSN